MVGKADNQFSGPLERNTQLLSHLVKLLVSFHRTLCL